jgi:hypothetical protein
VTVRAWTGARKAADLHPDVLDVDQDRDGADLVVLRASSAEGSLASGLAGQAGRQADVFRLPLTYPGNPLARPRGRMNRYPALDER